MNIDFFKKLNFFSAFGMAIVFLVSTGIAIAGMQNYGIFSNYLSDLGVKSAQSMFFNYGMILTGIFLIIFFNSLKRFLQSIQSVIGIVSGTISGIGLIGVGLFPENIEPEHSIVSAIFFITASIAVFFNSIALKKEKLLTKPFTARVIAIAIATVLSSIAFIAMDSPIFEHVTILFFGIWVLACGTEAIKVNVHN